MRRDGTGNRHRTAVGDLKDSGVCKIKIREWSGVLLGSGTEKTQMYV